MIALTFDDSPSDRETDLLLDTLEQQDVRATFFVIGQEVLERRAGSLQRAIAGGSEIGIHTYGHENLTQLQSEEVISTCAKCSWMIESVLNCRPVVMRAPGGNCNKEALNALRTLDLPNILWSVDSQDWKNKTSEQIAGTILKEVEDGSIILVHDTKDSTVEAIKTVVPELIERGYQFMTVSELFAYNGGLCSGKQYSAVGEADDPESEEAGFADMTIYDQDAVTVVFCGIDFDNSENVITLNISCNNFLEEIRKFRISGVEVNGEHFIPVEPLGALDPCSSTVYEFCISNVPGTQYGEIRSIRFAVEISDDKNERLAASKTVSIALEPEQETFSATAEAQTAPV